MVFLIVLKIIILYILDRLDEKGIKQRWNNESNLNKYDTALCNDDDEDNYMLINDIKYSGISQVLVFNQ